MTTNNNNISTKEFTSLKAQASKEVGNIQKSYFQLINTLNKLAARNSVTYTDTADNASETINTSELHQVAKVISGMHEYKEPFARCLLNKDTLGRFCGRNLNGGYIAADMPTGTSYAADIYEVTGNGRFCYDSENNTYCKPLTPTLQAVFNEFARIAQSELRVRERAAKAAAKAEKAAAKAAAKEARRLQHDKEAARLNLVRRYNNGELGTEELMQELAKIA